MQSTGTFGRETTKFLEQGFEQAIELVGNGGELVRLHLKRIVQQVPASYQWQRPCESARIAFPSK